MHSESEMIEILKQEIEALEMSSSLFLNKVTKEKRAFAIDALRTAIAEAAMRRLTDTQDWSELEALRESLREHMAEIHRLRAALAEPEQEPLEYWNAVEGWVKIEEVREHFDSVGCGTIYKTAGEDRVPVYAAPPPQRKPLTEEEIDRAWRSVDYKISYDNFRIEIVRAIERAHGIGGEK